MMFDSVERMASVAKQLDARGRTVYHACASFKEVLNVIKKGKPKQQVRVQSNALWTRSLWTDLDVGKDAEFSYDTQIDAVKAVSKFIKATGMPMPLLVNSGYGIHAYWPFTEDTPPEQWAEAAGLMRQAFRHLEIKFDPSRDQDIASVLRPVGSHNWKHQDAPKQVRIIKEGAPHPVAQLKDILTAYLSTNGVGLDAPRPAFLGASFANDLKSEVEYPPSSAAIIVKHCAQLRKFQEMQGAVDYPLWRDNLGLLKHTTEGDSIAHQWSQGYEGYSYDETQEKLDDWNTGPTTCAEFKRVNPSGCAGCPHSVKTPVQLGYAEEIVAAHVAPNPPQAAADVVLQDPAEVDAIDPAAELAAVEAAVAKKFKWNGARMEAYMPNAEGVVEAVSFADALFYPVARLRLEDGTAAFRMRMQVRKNVWREFDLEAKALADKRSFCMAMASHEINILNPKAALTYMQTYGEQLRARVKEINTYKQCGFTDNAFESFLIGDTLITPTESKPVLTVKALTDYTTKDGVFYKRKGSKQEWIDSVDTLYNHPEGLPYQFAICVAFGAVLAPMLKRPLWHGIPLALTSDRSARGKSTVAQIALSIYTDPTRLTVGETTPNGIPGIASLMGNLPCLFDEITNMEGRDLSQVLYALSNGNSKIRLTAAGLPANSLPGWDLVSYLTGNNNILHRLTENKRQNAEGAQARCFEVDLAAYPPLPAFEIGTPENATHPQIASRVLENCYGEIGLEYLRYVMSNRGKVLSMLDTVNDTFLKKIGVEGNMKERFYYHLITCTVVGATIAKSLGFIKFDIAAVRKWAVGHVARLREQARQTGYDYHDCFARMLADVREHMLVTKGFDSLDGRKDKWEFIPPNELPKVIKARMATEDRRLYIAVHAFDDWCKRNGVSAVELKRDLYSGGLIVYRGKLDAKRESFRTSIKVSLGKGVPRVGVAQTYCYEFNYDVAQGWDAENDNSAKVVSINEARKGSAPPDNSSQQMSQ